MWQFILHKLTKLLKKCLFELLQKNEVDLLFSSFDQIGDIIIIRIPDLLLHKKKVIGEMLLNNVKKAKTVYRQSSTIRGDFRIRDLELLAGVDNTKTEYKEYGCRFNVDIKKVFFSPRLSTERNRISNLVKKNETVVNMFGGIGMFSILIAKKIDCKVYNIDINPDAITQCKKNIGLNRLRGNVVPILGDASEIIEEFHNQSDRTLMLLPEKSDNFIKSAFKTTKNNGIMHYYCHIHGNKSNAIDNTIRHYNNVAKIKSNIINSRIVRAVGPKYYQTVLDIKITK